MDYTLSGWVPPISPNANLENYSLWTQTMVQMFFEAKQTLAQRMSSDTELKSFMDDGFPTDLYMRKAPIRVDPFDDEEEDNLYEITEAEGLISLLNIWINEAFYDKKRHDHLPSTEDRKKPGSYYGTVVEMIDIGVHWDFIPFNNQRRVETFLLSKVIDKRCPLYPLYKAGAFTRMLNHVCEPLSYSNSSAWSELPINLQHFLLKEYHVMLPVPHNTFLMGAIPNDSQAFSNEMPQHEVQFSRQFSMGKYPVTVLLWESIMGYDPKSQFPDYNKAKQLGVTRPMVNVSWSDCIIFCNKLSEREGLNPAYSYPDNFEILAREHHLTSEHIEAILQIKCNLDANGYRLPTEAEWECAARGGEYHLYSNGDDYDLCQPDPMQPQDIVGELAYKPNPVGLHNMSGNVWEWVWNWFHYNEDGTDGDYSETDRLDPIGPTNPFDLEDGCKKIVRGGSVAPMNMRVSRRNADHPFMRAWTTGFRLCKTV